MAHVVVTDAASFDQAGILTDLHDKAGITTVVKFRLLFKELYDLLARHPEIGALRPALGAGIRIGIVPPYVVFYRYDRGGDIVRILRLLHGRRRVTRASLTGRDPAPKDNP